jgi:hypothetical protein
MKKVGDKLKCVDPSIGLEEGAVYTVSDVDKKFIYLKEFDDLGFYPWRFEKAEEYTNQVNLNQSENQSMNSKRFVVRVGQNKDLARVVLDLLYKKGYSWYGDGKEPVFENRDTQWAFSVGYSATNRIEHPPFNWDGYKNMLNRFDAETEFGKFLSYLNEPEIPTILIRNTEGMEYKAEFTSHSVKFGCAYINNDIFIKLNELLSYNYNEPEGGKAKQETKNIEKIQIGKGVFKPSDIQAIVEHPEFGK